MDDVPGNLFSLFCSTWRAVLKMFMRLFQTKASESLEKGLAGAIYKEENRRQIEPLTTWQYKLRLEKPLQKLTINVAQSWIKQDRDRIKIKKATAKTDQTTWKRLRYTILSATGQYQSSLGLLGKPTNMQNIYYCKIINGSYMVWPGKVWLLRKINRKEDKDYIMINIVTFVHTQRLEGFGLWMRWASLAFLRQSRSYLSISIGISNIWETEWLLLKKCSETAVWM